MHTHRQAVIDTADHRTHVSTTAGMANVICQWDTVVLVCVLYCNIDWQAQSAFTQNMELVQANCDALSKRLGALEK